MLFVNYQDFKTKWAEYDLDLYWGKRLLEAKHVENRLAEAVIQVILKYSRAEVVNTTIKFEDDSCGLCQYTKKKNGFNLHCYECPVWRRTGADCKSYFNVGAARISSRDIREFASREEAEEAQVRALNDLLMGFRVPWKNAPIGSGEWKDYWKIEDFMLPSIRRTVSTPQDPYKKIWTNWDTDCPPVGVSTPQDPYKKIWCESPHENELDGLYNELDGLYWEMRKRLEKENKILERALDFACEETALTVAESLKEKCLNRARGDVGERR